jgi:hypothetical protein
MWTYCSWSPSGTLISPVNHLANNCYRLFISVVSWEEGVAIRIFSLQYLDPVASYFRENIPDVPRISYFKTCFANTFCTS